MFDILVGLKPHVVEELNEINKDHRVRVISFLRHTKEGDDRYSILIHKSKLIKDTYEGDSLDDFIKNTEVEI